MTDGGYRRRLERAASGQQKGSKRPKSSLRERAQISSESPQTRRFYVVKGGLGSSSKRR